MTFLQLLFLFQIFSLQIIQIISQEENIINQYKCGVDLHEHIPKKIESIPVDKNSAIYRRRLQNVDSEGFKKFNIYLDLLNIEKEIELYNLTDFRDTFIDSM